MCIRDSASIEDAEADLKRQFYGWRKFALTGTSVNYDTGTAVPAEEMCIRDSASAIKRGQDDARGDALSPCRSITLLLPVYE